MSQQKAQLVSPIETFTPPGLNVTGVVTATSFVGSGGTVTGLSGTPNLIVGVLTATSYSGNGANLTGVGSSAFVGQSTTSQSPTTTINLSLGNVIYFTHNTDTTVAFANTSSVQKIKFIRVKDDNTTAREITWPTNLYWDGDITPTLIDSSSTQDVQIFNLTTRDQGVTWYGYEAMKNDPDGTLWTWGAGSNGMIGINDRANRSSPHQVPGNQWRFISNGNNNSYATKTDGTLWTWGSNSYGRLAQNDSTTINRSSPTQIPGTQWDKITSGAYAAYATKTDGTLWSWGGGGGGRLGVNDTVFRSSPTQVPGTQWSSIFSGYFGPIATKTDGTLWMWGNNYNGQLGQNNRIEYSSPIQVPGVSWDTNPYKNGWISSQAVGAIKTDGTLWAWGSYFAGSLGQNSTIGYSSPRQIPGTTWKYISNVNVSNGGTLTTKTDGTLWAWGYNNQGQSGLNDAVDRSSPIQIPGTQWNLVSSNYFAMSTKTDATLWIWGGNNSGRLGLNDTISRSSPYQIPGTQWSSISGGSGSMAIKSPA